MTASEVRACASNVVRSPRKLGLVAPMFHSKVVLLSYYRHQSALFSVIAEALSKNVKVRHLKVYPLTLERVLTAMLGHEKPPTELTDRVVRYYYLKKTFRNPGRDTARWRRCLHNRATQWYHLFRRKLAGADLLMVWNGYAVPLAAAVEAAKSLGVKTMFCENGVLPGTLAMDPQGINCANSIAGRPPQFYENIVVEPRKADLLFGMKPRQRPLRKQQSGFSPHCDDGKALPERYVFFAMQVHDDSQVLLFSPRFSCMEDAVLYVAERVAAYNSRTGDSLRLVAKEHPSDFGRVDYSALRACLPDVYFLRSTPASRVIAKAQAVITLNSAVGVEALLALRPVITLGEAFYNVPRVVRHLGAEEDLADAIAEVIDRPVNRDLITKFLYFLRYEYLVPVSRTGADICSVEPAVERILDILHDRLSWVA